MLSIGLLGGCRKTAGYQVWLPKSQKPNHVYGHHWQWCLEPAWPLSWNLLLGGTAQATCVGLMVTFNTNLLVRCLSQYFIPIGYQHRASLLSVVGSKTSRTTGLYTYNTHIQCGTHSQDCSFGVVVCAQLDAYQKSENRPTRQLDFQ